MSTVNIAVSVESELLDRVRASNPHLSFDEACSLAVHIHFLSPVLAKLAQAGQSVSITADIGPWQIPIHGDPQ